MATLPDLDWDNIGPRIVATTPLTGAGSLTLIGAHVGMVVQVVDAVTGANVSSSFESVVSVANQLQQTAAIPGNHVVKIVAVGRK